MRRIIFHNYLRSTHRPSSPIPDEKEFPVVCRFIHLPTGTAFAKCFAQTRPRCCALPPPGARGKPFKTFAQKPSSFLQNVSPPGFAGTSPFGPFTTADSLPHSRAQYGVRMVFAIPIMKKENQLPQQAQSSKDGRLVAYLNERSVLQSIRNFGHARLEELATMVWPYSPHESARAMARRTIRRLIETGLIERLQNALGTKSYVLSRKGARHFKNTFGDLACAGRDIHSLRGATFLHRTLATAYLASRVKYGDIVAGEYALAKGYAGNTAREILENFDKKPDGLVRLGTASKIDCGIRAEIDAFNWIEVESAFKSDSEITRILDIGLNETLSNRTGAVLANVEIVFDASEPHERRIVRVARKLVSALDENQRALALQRIVFVRCELSIPFQLLSCEKVMLADALNTATSRPVKSIPAQRLLRSSAQGSSA